MWLLLATALAYNDDGRAGFWERALRDRACAGLPCGFPGITLEECHERVFSTDAGVEQVVLGLYIVRGDNIAIVGEVDEEKDAELDLNAMTAEPLKPVVH